MDKDKVPKTNNSTNNLSIVLGDFDFFKCISTLSVSWRGMCDGCNCPHMKVKEGSMQKTKTKETEGTEGTEGTERIKERKETKETKGAGEDFELGRGKLTCLFEEQGGLTIGLG